MNKLAILFPGQGAQFVGMMQDIVAGESAAAQVFTQADNIAGRNISKLTFEGPDADLNLTENTQPCMLTAEIAVLKAIEKAGIKASACIGFSLGEWAALVATRVITFEEALKLVTIRAAAMQRAVPVGQGGMAVVLGKTEDEVRELCSRAKGYVEAANYNCPGQIALAGDREGIDSLMALAQAEGILANQLAVSIPSHCKLMEPAARELEQAIQSVEFHDPCFPIVMNCCAHEVTLGTEVKSNVIKQLTTPVYLQSSIERLLDLGYDEFLELGPGNTLTKFVKKCAKAKGVKVSAAAIKSWDELTQAADRLIKEN